MRAAFFQLELCSQPLSDTDADDVEEADAVDVGFSRGPLCRGSESAFEQRFFGGSGPIHYLRAYAKAYASLRGLRGAPTRSQVSFQAPTYAGKR